MAANTSIGEIVATTLRNRQAQIADNISQNNALLSRLRTRGNMNTVSGGRTILQPLIYAENSNFKFYSGYEVLDTTPTEVIDAAEYNWKQAAANVVYSGLETRIQNAGKEQVIDLLDARMQAAETTLANQISVAIYSNGTGSSGKTIDGLQAAIPVDNSSGTYGGISRVSNTFWRNQRTSAAAISASADTLETNMRSMWISCTQGGETPDLIIAESVAFSNYWSRLASIQRITESTNAVGGFQSLKFVNADVVYDGDSMASNAQGSAISVARMYFLNTKYLFFRAHPEANFTPLSERNPVNQDAGIVPIIWAGNMTCSQARVQGVLTA
jgi:hypothetical protein